MKSRKRYTKKDKLTALWSISNGKKPLDALIDAGYDENNPNITDKKYCLKLINKWKQQLYKNKEISALVNRTYNNLFFEEDKSQGYYQEEEPDIIIGYYTDKSKIEEQKRKLAEIYKRCTSDA